MARPPSPKVGRGRCPSCNEPVTYRRSAGGLLTHNCDHCDSSGYAQPGGLAHAARMATIEQPAPEPGPAPSPSPAPAPEGRRASSVFNLADL